MDNIGKHVLLPSAMIGLGTVGAVAFYRWYKGDNKEAPSSSTNGSKTPTKLISIETSNIVGKNVQHRPECAEQSPVFTDGEAPVPAWNKGPKQTHCSNCPVTSTCTLTEVDKRKLTPAVLKNIRKMEDRFFNGLDIKAKLSPEDLKKISDIFLDLEDREQWEESFKHILNELQVLGHFEKPFGFYKTKILKILDIVEINPNKQVIDHLDLFDETILGMIISDLEKSEMAANFKTFQNDIVLIHSDDDHSVAVNLFEEMKNKLKTKDAKIVSYSEIDGNRTELGSLENIFDLCIYVFVLVSKNFKSNDLERYKSEICLTECLYNKHKKWRVIPLWLEQGIKKSQTCPVELKPLKGIDYYHILEKRCERSTDIVLNNIDKLIEKGRKDIQPLEAACENALDVLNVL